MFGSNAAHAQDNLLTIADRYSTSVVALAPEKIAVIPRFGAARLFARDGRSGIANAQSSKRTSQRFNNC
jgi:hypothetical protein